MIRINVFITQVNGERLWGVDAPLPPQVQIAVNINILGLERKTDSLLEAPFAFSVNFTPSIAQMSMRGSSQLTGDKKDLESILDEFTQKKTPPQQVVQAVSNAVLAESILISKTLGIPPPIPPISIPSQQVKKDGKLEYMT